MDRLAGLPAPVRVALFAVAAMVVIGVGMQAMAPGPATPAPGDAAPGPVEEQVVVPQAPTTGTATPRAGRRDATADLDLPLTAAQVRDAARRAVTFTETFVGDSYLDDPSVRARALARMLSTGSQVDLNAAVPSGAVRQQMVADQRVTVATVTDIEVVLVSTNTVVLAVVVDKETTARGGRSTGTVDYQVTLTRQATGWKVTTLYLADGSTHGHQEG